MVNVEPTFGFFAALAGVTPADRSYTDVVDDAYEKWRFPGEGVVSGILSELAVSALGSPAMKVNVAAGVAISGRRWLSNSATYELDIDDNGEADPRIDSVVVRFRITGDLYRDAILAVKKGVAAASPVAPDMTRSTDVHELRLADIDVAAGETQIQTADIHDKRSETDCGWLGARMGKAFSNADGSINAGTMKITDVADPDADTDAANKGHVAAAIAAAVANAGGNWKGLVVAATTASVTLANLYNGQALDGVTMATGDRILVKNQADGGNGIYVVKASGAPDRAADFTSAALALGASIAVTGGTVNGGTAWRVTNTTIANFGTTVLTFMKYVLDAFATSSVTGTVQCETLLLHPTDVKMAGGIIKRAGVYNIRMKNRASGGDQTGKVITYYINGTGAQLGGGTAGNYGTDVDITVAVDDILWFYTETTPAVTDLVFVQFRNADGYGPF